MSNAELAEATVPAKPVFTREEVASLTGYSVGALNNMATRGVGPKFLKPTKSPKGKVVYPRSEVVAFLAGERSK